MIIRCNATMRCGEESPPTFLVAILPFSYFATVIAMEALPAE
jgi:hypothetical protein